MEQNDRKAFIQKGFDTVATGYDNPSLSFFPETATRMVEHLKLEPHHNLLDVCCGTGVVSLTAAEKLTDGTVIGIDLSDGMLEQARAKAMGKGLSNTEFKQMDLDYLEFEAESFDVATSSFGLFFLEDMTAGLNNIASKVRQGGKIAISSFMGDAFAPMSDMFVERYESTGREMPPLSWKQLATKELITEQFNKSNITKVEVHHEPLGYQMTSSQQWWDVVWNAGWRSFLNQLPEVELEVFKVEHLNDIEEVLGDEGVWFNTEVLIAIGEK